MKKYLTLICLILMVWLVRASEVTMIVTSLPANTPAGDSIFIAGNFNGWNPGNPAYVLYPNTNGHPQIVIEGSGAIQFKFTRGNWQKVEGNATGSYLPNRIFTFGTADTLFLTILSWEDLGGTGSTAAQNVSIMSNAFAMPQLNRTRRIWIYLPPGYDTSTKYYPVLYMHDGQNLFDTYTAFAGEWEVDETLNAWHANGKEVPIVVGIDNGGVHRIAEYTPWTHPQYGGGEGDLYARFLVETLKPHIDANYRTLPQREHTGVMGSSLGGLISHYIGLKYQEVFSKAGIFSPSFWFSDSSFSFAYETGKNHPMRYYMMGGSNESSTLVQDMNMMMDTLIAAGFNPMELFLKVVPGGQHNELLWRSQFGEAYEWLFLDETTGRQEIEKRTPFRIRLVNRRLYLEADKALNTEGICELSLFPLNGQLVFKEDLAIGGSVSLPPGLNGIFIIVSANKNQRVSWKIFLQ